jgi:hypothetical protein
MAMAQQARASLGFIGAIFAVSRLVMKNKDLLRSSICWFFFPALPLFASCDDASQVGIQPATTDEVHRFVIDRFTLPLTDVEVAAYAIDLGGRRRPPENLLGSAIPYLAREGYLNPQPQDVIAAGKATNVVELFADSLSDDTAAGVLITGVAGFPVAPIGGHIQDGKFISNLTANTTFIGETTIQIPIFADATPSVVQLSHYQLELVSDGRGGYDGRIFGLVPKASIEEIVGSGMAQSLNAHPEQHSIFYPLLNTNRDRRITGDEVLNHSIVSIFSSSETKETPNGPFVGSSFGFGIHLLPCAEGSCAQAPSASCFDLAKNGDETDIDCGGSCGKCIGGRQCALPADCAYNACESGVCADATCDDGIDSVWESDVDCGVTCGSCDLGQHCWSNADCTSGKCGGTCE